MAKEMYIHRPLINESNDSDDERLLPDPQPDRMHHGIKVYSSCYRLSIASVILIFVTISSIWIGMQIQAHRSVDQVCAVHTTLWSPLLQDVSIKYKPQRFDGSFMKENIYRQKGSPEVDAAWEALGVDYRAGIISEDDGLASGLNSSFVQRASKYGGGFLVNVEGMHHLHCLNLLRKSLYFNYDHYKLLGQHAFKNEEPILRRHVTHCLDTIRQVMMCNVDTGVLGQIWVDPNEPMAFPDFNTQHVCKNYESVRQWAERIQAPPYDETPGDFLKPPSSEDIVPMIP